MTALQSSPRTAVVWRTLSAELARQGRPPVPVVDAGGGTGGFAVPLAQAGHDVTVVDASPDALAGLTRRAAEAAVAERIHALQGDVDALPDLVPAGSTGLVLCHNLLEMVDDPAPVLAAIAAILRPGGAVSVLVANQPAAVLARAMHGQFDAAVGLLAGAAGARSGGRGEARRRYDSVTASQLLTQAGLTVEAVQGVRVLADLIPSAAADHDPANLLALELALAGRSPYRDIAAQLHLLARRPGQP